MGICNSIPIHESVRNEIIEIEHNTTPHQQIKYQKNCPDPYPIQKNMPLVTSYKNTNSD